MLLLLFKEDLIAVSMVVYCLACALSAASLLAVPLKRLVPFLARKVEVPLWEESSLAWLLLLPACMAVAAHWFFTRHLALRWLLQDLMSVLLCIRIVTSMRFSNLKVPPSVFS